MFIYLDTETTGSGPEDKLCQIAFKTDTGTTMDNDVPQELRTQEI
jgi:hypothetical protein